MKENFIDKLMTISIGGNIFKLKEIDNNSVTLLIETHYDVQLMNLLLQKYNLAHRDPHIY